MMVRRQQMGDRSGFSLVELVLVLGIIGCCLLFYCGFMQHGRDRAREASCASNVKGLAAAMIMYASDYAQTPSANAPTAIMPYVKNEQIFQCPTASAQRPSNVPREAPAYFFAAALALDDRSSLVAVGDNEPRHRQGGNIGHWGGYVKWYEGQDWARLAGPNTIGATGRTPLPPAGTGQGEE